MEYNWFFYRVSGDTVQRPFGNYVKSDGFGITGTSNWPSGGNGNTSSYQWTEFGPPGGVRFTATYSMTLSQGPATTDARLDESFQISNPNSTALTLLLYNAAGMDPDSRPSGFNASGDSNSISVTDGIYNLSHSAAGAGAYQVATDSSLASLLYGGTAADLNDTGLPIVNSTGLILDAFEWSVVVPAGGSQTVSTSLIISRAVPEPSSLLLSGVVGAAGVVAMPRRYSGRRGGADLQR